jgi:hypothetical protein
MSKVRNRFSFKAQPFEGDVKAETGETTHIAADTQLHWYASAVQWAKDNHLEKVSLYCEFMAHGVERMIGINPTLQIARTEPVKVSKKAKSEAEALDVVANAALSELSKDGEVSPELLTAIPNL